MSASDDSTLPDGWKRCTACEEPKPLVKFARDPGATGGYRNQCKACRAKAQRERRQKDPEKNRRYQREWWANNPKAKDWARDYRSKNRDNLNAKQREARRRNPERFLTKDRERYQRDREQINAKRRVRRAANPEKYRNVEYRYRSENRGRLYAWRRVYTDRNRDTINANARLWRDKNKERLNAQQREDYARNPEPAKDYSKRWRRENPQRRKVQHHRREARKRELPASMTSDDMTFALGYFNGCCAVCGNPPGLWTTLAWDHWIPLTSPVCPGTVPENILPLCHSMQDGYGGCNSSKHNKDPLQWLQERFGKRKAKEIEARIQAFFEIVKTRK